jgi:hypothetical protein
MLASAATVIGGAQSPPRRPAVPVDPIAAILDAFRSNAVVALSEGPHGNEQALAFRLALIRDLRFSPANDLVVESGRPIALPRVDEPTSAHRARRNRPAGQHAEISLRSGEAFRIILDSASLRSLRDAFLCSLRHLRDPANFLSPV